jgi:hypothetical protein
VFSQTLGASFFLIPIEQSFDSDGKINFIVTRNFLKVKEKPFLL